MSPPFLPRLHSPGREKKKRPAFHVRKSGARPVLPGVQMTASTMKFRMNRIAETSRMGWISLNLPFAIFTMQ